MLHLTVSEGLFREALEESFDGFVDARTEAVSDNGEFEDHAVVIDVPARVSRESPHVYERFRQQDEVPHFRLLLQFQNPRALYEASIAMPRDVTRQVIDQRHINRLAFDEVTEENRTAFIERIINSYRGDVLSNDSVRIQIH